MVAHVLLCAAGFWIVTIVAFAIAESNYGPAPWWFAPLEKFVMFVLLQPLAYWVLATGAIRYWTWFGLTLSIIVFIANSVLAISIVRVAVRLASQRST